MAAKCIPALDIFTFFFLHPGLVFIFHLFIPLGWEWGVVDPGCQWDMELLALQDGGCGVTGGGNFPWCHAEEWGGEGGIDNKSGRRREMETGRFVVPGFCVFHPESFAGGCAQGGLSWLGGGPEWVPQLRLSSSSGGSLAPQGAPRLSHAVGEGRTALETLL